MEKMRAVIYSPTSFGVYPVNEMKMLLNELALENLQEIPFGITGSFDSGSVIINGLCSCHFDVQKNNEELINAYLIRLQRILNLLKDYSINFSDKVDISLDNVNKNVDECIYNIIDSVNKSIWITLIIHLNTKTQRNLMNIDKKISAYAQSLGWIPVYVYRENKEFRKNQGHQERTYNLTIKLRKNSYINQ